MDRLRERLGRPTDAAALSAYRVVFGLMMSVSALRFLYYGWVDELFVKPTFFFKYWGFAWVGVPPPAIVHAIFWAIVVLGLLIAVGLFYRAAMIAFVVLFAWIQLMDVTNYLNHYYLIVLLAALMAAMPLGRAHSIDALRGPRTEHHPFWCTALLRFQVAIVYFFAAIAKATGDWLLHAQPISIWLAARTGTPILGPLLAHPFAPRMMSVSGFLFDATIWMFLLVDRTRRFAYPVLVVFHALTMILFPIGMFPVIMVVTALVFFSPDWPRRLLRRAAPSVGAPTEVRKPAVVAMLVYCALQIVVPLRTFAYGGNVLWHEQGMRWSWRVMCREKNASVTYWVEDPAQQRTWAVSPRTYLTDRQLRELGTQPDLVLQLAHRIADDWRARTGAHEVIVRADVLASLNGRRAVPLVDPAIDLARTRDGLSPAGWIAPAPAGSPPPMRPPIQ